MRGVSAQAAARRAAAALRLGACFVSGSHSGERWRAPFIDGTFLTAVLLPPYQRPRKERTASGSRQGRARQQRRTCLTLGNHSRRREQGAHGITSPHDHRPGMGGASSFPAREQDERARGAGRGAGWDCRVEARLLEGGGALLVRRVVNGVAKPAAQQKSTLKAATPVHSQGRDPCLLHDRKIPLPPALLPSCRSQRAMASMVRASAVRVHDRLVDEEVHLWHHECRCVGAHRVVVLPPRLRACVCCRRCFKVEGVWRSQQGHHGRKGRGPIGCAFAWRLT